jgi:arginine utilization protein RocB
MKSSVRIFGFIWLSAIAINLSAQNFAKDSTKLFKYIFFLSSDSLGGRLGGSINEKSAADYIVLQLKKSKIKPFFEKSYIQNFEFTYEGQTHYSQNVAAFIDNKVDSTIIIISHYDHIGNGGKLSKSFGSDKIHPGADDNASGVAANLLLAEKVKKRNNKKFNYIFLFTGAHECGLFGSKYFCEMLDELQLKIKYVINLDMIGRLDEETKTLVFSSHSRTV